MIDRIIIRDLLLRAIVGINDDERVNRQDVLINIVLWADMRPAARSDSIEDAVNYRTITKEVIDYVEASKCYLVERLAEEVASVCLRDARVTQVEISIEKPTALRFARSVGITIVRSRESGS